MNKHIFQYIEYLTLAGKKTDIDGQIFVSLNNGQV